MNNTKLTKSPKLKDIKREWHLIDVKDKVLGRESTQIARLLMGKGKPYFIRNLDLGDYVIVVNAKEVKTTGKKDAQKNYYRHSGYPGGLRTESLGELRKRRPEEVIRHAVSGMLPQNRLRDKMLKRLKVYPAGDHPFADKLKKEDKN